MKKTYILGNGGYAQEVFEQIFLRNVISNFGGFIILKDNKAFLIGDEGVAPFTYPKESAFILGTGNKAWRQLFIEHFLKYYPPLQTYQHKNSMFCKICVQILKEFATHSC